MSIHLIVPESEQLAIINSLAFFEHSFRKNSVTPPSDVVEEWQDVADDTNIEGIDALATRIANSH